MNIAFLASYNGSSAQAITNACLEGDLRARPSLMISNNEGSVALQWASDKGLKTACLNGKTNPIPDNLDEAIAQKLQEEKIKLVICSGYMKLIGPKTIDAFKGRILNVHPALLPKHGGKGMYGRNIHKAVKDAGDNKTGITIHIVDGEYDKGTIIAQKEIAITPLNTIEDIENKVKEAEPAFYIKTISKILSGDITLPE